MRRRLWTGGIKRLVLDTLRDSMFETALRIWDQSKGAPALAPAENLQRLCDPTTNLYLTDMSAATPLEWRIRIVNESVDMHRTGGERFGDYPDRAYFEQVVIPHYLTLETENQPMAHRIATTIQGRYAVYDRLMLPYLTGGERTCLALSRVLLVVEDVRTARPPKLSPRERECLRHLMAGRSAKMIAAETNLATKTVQHCVERVKTKLGARNVAEAVAKGALLLEGIKPPAAISSPPPLLSPRERQCLGLLASGRPWKRAAVELGLSPKTVEKHIESLKAKLGARNAAEAVVKGIESLADQLPEKLA